MGTLDRFATKTVTIAAGAATSDAVDIQGYRVVGALTTTAWTAADLGIMLDPTGLITPLDVFNSEAIGVKLDGFIEDKVFLFGNVDVSGSAGQSPPLVGVRAAVRSINAASEADVNQVAANIITLLLEHL